MAEFGTEEQYRITKELRQKSLYFVYVIADFAERYGLSPRAAFSYLQRYRGLDFIEQHYAAEHLLSMEDAVADLTVICQRHGGGLTL